ncbi:MAG: dethiobiotin synthase [Microcystaceae cyanobacterium]
MKTLLIAGTDTDVGKTWVTTALVAYLLKQYPTDSLGIIKLLQTGIGDEEYYQNYFSDNPLVEIITPLRFNAPLAPPLSAAKEGKTVDLGIIWRELNYCQQKYPMVIAEGLGGLGSPITQKLTVGDIAGSWQFNTLLVVPVKLGAIAHTVANVYYARSCKINLVGIILNCVQPTSPEDIENWTPTQLIESLTEVPVCGILPYLETVDFAKMVEIVSHWQVERFFQSRD